MVLALAMNRKVREVSVYRAVYYLPSILPLFASRSSSSSCSTPGTGSSTGSCPPLGLPSPNWLGDPAYTKLALVMIAQLGAGQFALVFLAGLRGVPIELYESADIDGAGGWQKFRTITLPLMTPIILYDLIIGLSFGLQVFTSAYILTGGGTNGGRRRQLAPDLCLLSLQAGLPVRPDGVCGRPVGRDVRRQRHPRGGRLPLGPQLGVLRRRGGVDGDRPT